IDLRTEAEVSRRGRIEWRSAEVAYHHLPMIDVLPPEDEYHAWDDPIHVAEQYVAMLSGGHETLRSALRLLSDPAAYPAVCHCMAGKDRTGILSALVLGLVGVADADIVADYALSAAAMTRLLERMRVERPDRQAQIDRDSAAIIAAEPATMEHFLARFRAEHGSFPMFAAALGLAGAAERLQEVLLEPG
ncbi:MAG: tyrosine-protein phosphatase, partial [Acidimicrobiales bacterium]